MSQTPAPASTRDARPLPKAAAPTITAFFFLTGASGLVYEVVWTRMLLSVFGASIHAVATVVAAFMGGLALGGILGGRLADKTRYPLRVYGILEILAGLAAVSVPLMLKLGDPLYQALSGSDATNTGLLNIARFILCFSILLIPTTCMGMTLPLLSRYLVKHDGEQGKRIGGLYAANTAGAVIGVTLAGFVLLEWLGVLGANFLAAGIGVAVGVAALAAAGHWTSNNLASHDPAAPGKPITSLFESMSNRAKLVLITYAAFGFSALAAQIAWTRILAFRMEFLNSTTYAFSVMLAVFLVGLAIGSALMTFYADRVRNPFRLYALILTLTGFAIVGSLLVMTNTAGQIRFGDPGNEVGWSFDWQLAVANVFLLCAVTIGPATILMGMAFPLAARICVESREQTGRETGALYASNTIGAIFGSFVGGFLLIPWLGLTNSLLAAAFISILAGAIVFQLSETSSPPMRTASASAGPALLAVCLAFLPGDHALQIVPEDSKIIAYEEGPLATVSVVEQPDGDRLVFVDNEYVAGTAVSMLTDQKSLAHVPMLLLENPRSAATVGFGSGGSSWSFTLYPELERIDCIEISETVPKMARHLKASNHGLLDGWNGQDLRKQSFHGGRYRVVLDDARSYLRFADHKYDIIATDCTNLQYKSSANLYNVEYFRICRQAITDDGLVVVWMPLGGLSPTAFACALKTFAHVFPEMTIWHMNNAPTHYLLLIGGKQPLRIEISRIQERLARPEIRADLAEISLHQPEKILSCFLQPASVMKEAFAHAPLNTDNHPYLEFQSPKYGFGIRPVLDNLELLWKSRVPIDPFLADADRHPEFIRRFESFRNASELVMVGHRQQWLGDNKGACQAYVKAAEIAPDDESIARELEFKPLREALSRNPDNLAVRLNLSESTLIKRDYAEAEALFRNLLEQQLPASKANAGQLLFVRDASLRGLARSLLGKGNPEGARQLLEQNRNRLKEDPDLTRLRHEIEQAIRQ